MEVNNGHSFVVLFSFLSLLAMCVARHSLAWACAIVCVQIGFIGYFFLILVYVYLNRFFISTSSYSISFFLLWLFGLVWGVCLCQCVYVCWQMWHRLQSGEYAWISVVNQENTHDSIGSAMVPTVQSALKIYYAHIISIHAVAHMHISHVDVERNALHTWNLCTYATLSWVSVMHINKCVRCACVGLATTWKKNESFSELIVCRMCWYVWLCVTSICWRFSAQKRRSKSM